jgi:transposase
MAHRPGLAESVWRERLARFASSGLSVKAFCEREGVSPSNFHAWKRRLGSGREHAPSRPKAFGPKEGQPLFVPVALNGQTLGHDSELRITLPGGAVVHVPLADGRVLAQVMEAVVKACGEGRSC